VFGPLFTGGVQRFRYGVLEKIINTENKCHDNILLIKVCRMVGYVRVDRGQNLKIKYSLQLINEYLQSNFIIGLIFINSDVNIIILKPVCMFQMSHSELKSMRLQ